jgi:glutathione S-transferase
MRLYVGQTLMTNPRRVTIYLAEKGIEIEQVPLDMRGGEGRGAAYLAKNPAATVPLLELDDGTCIPESAAIVEYFEELHPEPNLIGETPEARALTRAMDRIVLEFYTRNSPILVNTHPFMPRVRPGYVQHPAVAEAYRPMRDKLLATVEAKIGDKPFLCGDKVTLADTHAFAILHVQRSLFDYELPDTAPRLKAWYERFSQRPSALYS